MKEYEEILKRKLDYYGNTKMATDSAIEEYATTRMIEEANHCYRIFLSTAHRPEIIEKLETRISELKAIIKPAIN